MKVGDLVKMKYSMWWQLRERKEYIDQIALVLDTSHNAVKLMYSGGLIRSGLIEQYDIINESR